MKTVLASIAVVVGLTATCLGAMQYFAPMKAHMELASDYGQFKKMVRSEQIQERIWTLENYYQCVGVQDCSHKMPSQVFAEYRHLVSELESLTAY